MMNVDGAGSSSAKRRKERRLRAPWRHEQLSVRMALAAAQHSRSEECCARDAQTGTAAAGPQHFTFAVEEEPAVGARPAPNEIQGKYSGKGRVLD